MSDPSDPPKSALLHVRVGLALREFALDVEFTAPPGVTVLFGPSGAGKSRTLGCIAGIVKPDRGRIALGDVAWFDSQAGIALPIQERRVAYVFQSLALFPHMTAEQNVAYGIERECSAAERRARANEMLTRMRVPHLTSRKPRTFSGGEAQRVALARAFAMKPSVLLLDEPFSALDAQVKGELYAEVREWLVRDKVPSILVTHAPEEASELGDHLIVLEHGHVVKQAAMTEFTHARVMR